MKWSGHWWGTVITAESEDDNERLEQMLLVLKPEPHETYEDGELVVNRKSKFITVIFNR